MTIEKVTDHVTRAKENTITQYRDLPRYQAVVRSYSEQIQEIENVQWDVMMSYLLDNATGDRLDTIGKIVGQARKGANDDQYKLYILARIRVNRSNGLPSDIVGLMILLLQGTVHRYVPMWPMTFFIEALGLDVVTIDPDVVAELFDEVAAGGVRTFFHFSESGEDDILTFSTDDDFQHDVSKGFADDAGTTGGVWIGATE